MERRVLLVFLLLGLVSLLNDTAYEGMRGSVGYYIAGLGGPALLAAVLAYGELLNYVGRIASGALASLLHGRRVYAVLLYTGYGLNLSIPLMALVGDPVLVALLYYAERLGKGLRAPARDVLVSEIVVGLGRGKGFGLYELMDQAGAVAGALLVAYVAEGAGLRAAYLVLGVPVALGLAVLAVALAAYPWERVEPRAPGAAGPWLGGAAVLVVGLSLSYAGFIYWPLLSAMAAGAGLSAATVSLLYALAMLVDALAAPLLGALYDRAGWSAALAAPLAGAAATAAALAGAYPLAAVAAGVFLGTAESVYKAVLSDAAPVQARAAVFAAYYIGSGLAWALGNTLIAALGPAGALAAMAAGLASLAPIAYGGRGAAPRKSVHG